MSGKKWPTVKPAAEDTGQKQTITKENIPSHVKKHGGGLGMLASIMRIGLPIGKKKAEVTVQGQGRAEGRQERTKAEIEAEQAAYAAEWQGKQKTLLTIMPVPPENARANLKKTNKSSAAASSSGRAAEASSSSPSAHARTSSGAAKSASHEGERMDFAEVRAGLKKTRHEVQVSNEETSSAPAPESPTEEVKTSEKDAKTIEKENKQTEKERQAKEKEKAKTEAAERKKQEKAEEKRRKAEEKEAKARAEAEAKAKKEAEKKAKKEKKLNKSAELASSEPASPKSDTATATTATPSESVAASEHHDESIQASDAAATMESSIADHEEAVSPRSESQPAEEAPLHETPPSEEAPRPPSKQDTAPLEETEQPPAEEPPLPPSKQEQPSVDIQEQPPTEEAPRPPAKQEPQAAEEAPPTEEPPLPPSKLETTKPNTASEEYKQDAIQEEAPSASSGHAEDEAEAKVEELAYQEESTREAPTSSTDLDYTSDLKSKRESLGCISAEQASGVLQEAC